MLLEKGADPGEVDQSYNTPLHIAAKYDHPKVAEMLLEKGANVMKRNVDGCKPVELAPAHSAVKRVLEEAFDTLAPFSSAIHTPVMNRTFSPFRSAFGTPHLSIDPMLGHSKSMAWQEMVDIKLKLGKV